MVHAIIAGAFMTAFGRFPNTTLKNLASTAAQGALAEAGVDASEIEATFFANGVGGLVTGQEMIRGQAALRDLHLPGTAVYNVENACASGAAAFDLACMAINAGRADLVLVVGAEKRSHDDRSVSVQALETAADIQQLPEMRARSSSGSAFMDIYADMAVAYMAKSGATPADFAAVTVKSRALAETNTHAQFRMPTTVAAVLEDKMISAPLTRSMCSGIADGAAALVLMSPKRARERGIAGVRVRGSFLVSAIDIAGAASPAQRVASEIYERTAVDPLDLDVVELHDAAAPSELILYEKLGLCASGEGPHFLREGKTMPNGRVAVNPGGGLLSRGHPIGATGCAQLVELSRQLTGRAGAAQKEGARLALAQNQGGYIGDDAAAAAAIILESA